MHYTVERYMETSTVTLGKLYTENRSLLCYTLEDAYNYPKIRGKSRIPAGTYDVFLNMKSRFQSLGQKRFSSVYGKDWHRGAISFRDEGQKEDVIRDKSGSVWRGIRLHWGNYHTDTSGCLLVGTGIKHLKGDDWMLTKSTAAYADVYPLIRDDVESGSEVTITYTEVL